ncbi:MAG TPA: hypothetical protein VHH73_15510 [Verrucomicrobiae bacterium]|nr:hypothetical protein [Verrucomicrobiae bacterium]
MTAACLALGQGTVNFNNHTTAVSVPVFSVGGSTPVSGPEMVAALFFNGVQQGAPAPFRTGNKAGYWDPGADSTRIIEGVPGGQSATIEVRAWDSSRGATYDATVAAGGGYGKSDPFTVVLGGAGDPPTVPADMIGFKSFECAMTVPEPATCAIFLAGAAGTAGWPRRKKAVHAADSTACPKG